MSDGICRWSNQGSIWKNSNEPEFIQAVTEVLESLRPVVEADDRYEKMQF